MKTPGKGGRPLIVLDDKQKKIIKTCSGRLNAEQIADMIGVSRSSFFEIMQRDEVVSGLYKKGRSKTINKVAKILIDNALDGDTTSLIFYLKTQAGWKETTATEHTGKDGGAIEVTSIELIAGTDDKSNG